MRIKLNRKLRKSGNNLLALLACFLVGNFIGDLLSGTSTIGMAFGTISLLIPKIIAERRKDRNLRKLQKLWPEILDHLISGLNSGLSLAQTIVSLGNRGPIQTREIFMQFGVNLKSGMNFGQALGVIKNYFADPIADQICEVIDFAKSTGSRDCALTLRTLSTYVRNDLKLHDEIAAKHGWIKNAALLAAIAPWLLLIILSTQNATRLAYKSSAGVSVLLLGAGLTIAAFFWMKKVGKLEETPRIFMKATYPE